MQGYAIALPSEGAGAVVTFEAYGEDHRPFQQARVHGTVRGMAGFAAFDSSAWMLKCEGAAFVDMTTQAWLFAVSTCLHHPWAHAHSP